MSPRVLDAEGRPRLLDLFCGAGGCTRGCGRSSVLTVTSLRWTQRGCPSPPSPPRRCTRGSSLESGEYIEAVMSGLGKIGWEISYMGTEGFAQDARPAFIDALAAIHKEKGGEDV